MNPIEREQQYQQQVPPRYNRALDSQTDLRRARVRRERYGPLPGCPDLPQLLDPHTTAWALAELARRKGEAHFHTPGLSCTVVYNRYLSELEWTVNGGLASAHDFEHALQAARTARQRA